MAYCVGLLCDTGLVMLSDSRTNAGVDQINTFRKMATFQHAQERVLVLMSAGNLGITQAVVNLLETADDPGQPTRFLSAPNMFAAARVVGDALRSIHRPTEPADLEPTSAAWLRLAYDELLAGQLALALLRGRGHVASEDIRDLATDVLRHRIVLSYDALSEGVPADELLEKVLAAVPEPGSQHLLHEAPTVARAG